MLSGQHHDSSTIALGISYVQHALQHEIACIVADLNDSKYLCNHVKTKKI